MSNVLRRDRPDHEVRARWEYADGLRALANFIEDTPGAPLPPGPFRYHYYNADEFDRAVVAIGAVSNKSSSGYEVTSRFFGPIEYGAQTDGRKAQQIRRREETIAARERELGLSDDDLGVAA